MFWGKNKTGTITVLSPMGREFEAPATQENLDRIHALKAVKLADDAARNVSSALKDQIAASGHLQRVQSAALTVRALNQDQAEVLANIHRETIEAVEKTARQLPETTRLSIQGRSTSTKSYQQGEPSLLQRILGKREPSHQLTHEKIEKSFSINTLAPNTHAALTVPALPHVTPAHASVETRASFASGEGTTTFDVKTGQVSSFTGIGAAGSIVEHDEITGTTMSGGGGKIMEKDSGSLDISLDF